MASPVVVRLKRTAGQVVQGCDVYIGRRIEMGGWHLAESKWSNPFKLGPHAGAQQRQDVLDKYEAHIRSRPDLLARIGDELSGKTLGCWCKPEACHGDVLVKLWSER